MEVDGVGCHERSAQRMSKEEGATNLTEEDDPRRKTGKQENVQKEKRKTVERFKKCRERGAVDWSKRGRPSHQWEIEKNQETIENRQKRSRKEWKRGDQKLVCLDEFGKIEGEMGTVVR